MKNYCKLFLLLASVLVFGCACNDNNHSSAPAAQVRTTVNVVSHTFSADDFDLATVVARLQKGDLEDAKALQDYINESGVSNIDIDKDGSVDPIYVSEESKNDSQVLVAKAHPKSGEPVVVMEASFTKTASGDIQMQAAYPQHVAGHHNHYYNHTLTGSVLGDMMFYHYLFRPHTLFMPTYGAYGYAPRPVMSQSNFSSSRTTYRKTNNVVSPTPKAKPQSYTPKSTATKTANKSFSKKKASGGTLSSKSGNAKSYQNRDTAKSKPKANSFKQKAAPRSVTKPRSVPKPSRSWGSSRGGGFRGGSRRSSAEYKNHIQYLSEQELVEMAETLYNLPVATWYYNEDELDDVSRQRLGIIVEDAEGAPNSEHLVSGEDHVDLYGYTSMTIVAAQVQQQQIRKLQEEIENLRNGICQ